jgi:Uma2 family endonuclease
MKILARWTVEDYHRMIAAGILFDRSVELLAGEIIEMAPEGPIHKFYAQRFADYLRDRLTGRALIREAAPITLADSEPEPDIAVVQLPNERYRDRHPNPEDIFWLIESSNTSLKKDLEMKQPIYAEAGIQEYWVIDLQNQQLIVFRSPQNSEYTFKQELRHGSVSPQAFLDVVVSVEQLLS